MKKIFIPVIFIIFPLISFSIDKIDYKNEMRSFIQNISKYSRTYKKDFIVIPQNGQDLITDNGTINGKICFNYIKSINGLGREELFYGYNGNFLKTPVNISNNFISFLNIAKSNSLTILTIDYCKYKKDIDDSYNKNNKYGYISTATEFRDLNGIPNYPDKPEKINKKNINKLGEVQNFLYLINPENFSSKNDFIRKIKKTDFDMIIIDLFFFKEMLLSTDIDLLRKKNNGSKRLIICYMSIGEAEDYRYYWNKIWLTKRPEWLLEENKEWEGNYKVKYWDKNWQKIIFGNNKSYLKKIIDSKFDGVYLDIVDAFEYFEN